MTLREKAHCVSLLYVRACPSPGLKNSLEMAASSGGSEGKLSVKQQLENTREFEVGKAIISIPFPLTQ